MVIIGNGKTATVADVSPVKEEKHPETVTENKPAEPVKSTGGRRKTTK